MVFSALPEEMGSKELEARGLPVEIQVGVWLRRRELQLVTAESCTGGLISDLLTNVPGSSEYFLGGIVAYAYEVKEKLLGVRHETLAQFGAVSSEVAIEMARGARLALAGSTPVERMVAVSVSGVAGPGGGSPEKPVGTTWIGLSAVDVDRAWRFVWQGDRHENKILSARQSLQILLDYLQGKVM